MKVICVITAAESHLGGLRGQQDVITARWSVKGCPAGLLLLLASSPHLLTLACCPHVLGVLVCVVYVLASGDIRVGLNVGSTRYCVLNAYST